MPHRARALLASIFVLCATFAFAQSSTMSPRDVVAEYCKLDTAGALTSSEGWPAISPLFVWPDAPGWDTFTVVRGYKVGEEKIVGNTATVPVEYDVAGILDSTPRFRAAKLKKVTVVYHLVFTNKQWVMDADGNPDRQVAGKVRRWQIAKPQNEPHVGYEKALKMANDWLADASDSATRQNAEAALRALTAAR